MNTSEPNRDDSRRGAADRRVHRLPWWHPRRLHGRRAGPRRGAEETGPYLVERVPRRVAALATMILVLTLTDGILTLALLEHGFEEANPVMRYLLGHGPSAFLVGKYLLTAAFLPVALVADRYRLFGTPVRVGHFVPIVAALYIALVAYQINLLAEEGGRDFAGAPAEHPSPAWKSR